MTSHTWLLLAVLVASIAALIALINSRLRAHPFVALLIVSVAAGLVAGEPVDKLAKSIEDGAGTTLGNVGLTLALGAMLGRLLAESGATDRIARMIIARAGNRSMPWFMAGAALVIGIPMFFEVGLIVLLPLIFSVAERLRASGKAVGSPYVVLSVPTIAALSTLHGMLPPHPGPLVGITALNADLGLTMVLGIVCAIPTVALAGPASARRSRPRPQASS